MKRIAILGAGLTGLTLASILSKNGHKVTVIEKEEEVGGLARTFSFDGQLYDMGPHEFCTNNKELVGILKDLLGEDFLVCGKSAAQFFMKRFIDYPVKPLHFLSQVDKLLLLRIFGELVYFRFKNLVSESMDYSFEHWVTNRFGATMYDLYFKPYTEKVWGLDPGLLDPRTASDRIAFNSVFDIIHQTLMYNLFRKEQYGSAHSPLKSSFYYSKGGIGRLLDRLHERCLNDGCEIKTGWEVKKAITEHGVMKSIVNQHMESMDGFDLFVSTIPITTLNVALDKTELNSNLEFRSMIFCFLDIPLEHLSPYHWIYFPEKEYSFQRLTDFSHFNAGMTKQGRTGVCAEIACFDSDALWGAEDPHIVELVKKDLAKAGILKDAEGVKGWIRREKYAYPIQVNGFIEHVTHSVSYVKSIKNLVTTGRQGLYKYCNMNECMEMAIELAVAIEKGEGLSFSLESMWRGVGVEAKKAGRPKSARGASPS
jgi:protoporphyrinogen oxidase